MKEGDYNDCGGADHHKTFIYTYSLKISGCKNICCIIGFFQAIGNMRREVK